VVEAVDTNSLGLKSEKPALYHKIPLLSKESRGIFRLSKNPKPPL
jgi:hypothetical protein